MALLRSSEVFIKNAGISVCGRLCRANNERALLLRARRELFHQQNELGENFGLYLHR